MGRVAELRALVEETLGDLDPWLLHANDCVRLVEDVSAMKNMCAIAEADLARRIAETGVWTREGDQTRERWYARKTGCSVPEAKKALSTSTKLDELPETKKRAKAGELSPAQTQEIADAATADPKAEDRLLDHAASGQPFANLKSACEKVKDAARDDQQDQWEKAHRNRKLRFGRRDGESWLSGTDTPDAHAELLAVIAALRDLLQADAHEAGGEIESMDAYNADALREMARIAAAAIGLEVSPEEVDDVIDTLNGDAVSTEDVATADVATTERITPTPNRDARRAARFRRPKWRRLKSQVKVLVRIDYEALIRGFVEPGEMCEIDGIGPVSVASVEALMDNAFIASLITKGHDVCTVAHLGRGPTAHQRTALEWLAPRCTNSRCPNRRWLEIDHRTGWAETHRTELGDLDGLCTYCHDRKTHHGWTLDECIGRRPLRSPEERNQRAGPDSAPSEDASQERLDL